jgi:adenosylhomocysteine nucleosidase
MALCAVRWSGSGQTAMPRKPVAIVVAMRVEVAPLLAKMKTQPLHVDGVELFELPEAMVAVGGIGEKRARHSAELVIEHAQPKLLVSAGMAGALSPNLRVGDVGRMREVVDVATGDRYPTRGGEWVLATSPGISDVAEKGALLAKYAADVVDMEGAAVAQVAKERGLEFAAVKAISDDSAFPMPPLTRFIDGNGRFETRQFLVYVALHPRWWATLGKIRKNSKLASANLCRELQHLIEGSSQ